jgi:hypothetical protein
MGTHSDWNEFCTAAEIDNPVAAVLVQQLVFCFETLYTWCFFTVADMLKLQYFADTVGEFVAAWRTHIAPGRKRNYYHWLEVEALWEIHHHGSVWKYHSYVKFSSKWCFDFVLYILLM